MAKIDTKGRVKKDTLSEAEVNRTFAEALAAQPPSAQLYLYFVEKSTEIMPDSRAPWTPLAEVAKRQAVEVQITGHTDRVKSGG